MKDGIIVALIGSLTLFALVAETFPLIADAVGIGGMLNLSILVQIALLGIVVIAIVGTVVKVMP